MRWCLQLVILHTFRFIKKRLVRKMSTTNNAINTNDPIGVPNGGTGNSSFTPYHVLCAGTTTTTPLQEVATSGSTGDVLMSNGPSALPIWQASPNALVLLSTQVSSPPTGSFIFDNTIITPTFNQYFFVLADIRSTLNAVNFCVGFFGR